jgi:hypothetical protein
MEEKKTDTMIRINPRTGRNIIIGGKVWKSLTEEEKQKANNLFKKFKSIPPIDDPAKSIPPTESIESTPEAIKSTHEPIETTPPTTDPAKSTPPTEVFESTPVDDEDVYPIYKIDTSKSSAYIQNILTKTKEAEDRVKILLYRRFFESEDGW